MGIKGINRRSVLKAAAAGTLVSAFPAPFVRTAAAATELVHWSPNVASDGIIWERMINAFNDAHSSQGVQIRMELVTWDEYQTKLLAAAAGGAAPDFGWGTPARAVLSRDGVTVRLDDLAKSAGLDLSDFTESSLKQGMFTRYAEGLYQIPLDLMTLQPLVNTAHVAEAGLDLNNWPMDSDVLIDWADKMTKRDGDTVTRSGIMMTGSGLQPAVTWGIVAEQMGFKRVNDDYTEACINPDAGKAAMQWVLDLFDKHKVSSREVTDRYKAFGTGFGSIFWTGPWTLAGYREQKLPFVSMPFPNIGGTQRTYFEMGSLEMYVQRDKSRYSATIDAIKWLSDNSFLWTTEGRGVSPRKSIVSRDDYKTSGLPWEARGAFVEGLDYADIAAELPIENGAEFNIYSGNNILAKTLELCWAGQASIDETMDRLQSNWQRILDRL